MSMLAEPRRKQKWTLNPRGKHWSDDSNKFGQKMLEKMGWTSGKGLGAKEQGMTDHVRVAVKNDTVGIGFKNSDMDKAWTEHQDGFNQFLQKLQQSQGDGEVAHKEDLTETLSGKSLETKSKQSRARVHYQKFTRGKDVNKYSSKDLANIFGQKDLNTKSILEEESNEVKNSVTIGTEVNAGGLITIHGGNMTDYFLKKGRNFAAIPKKNSRSDAESQTENIGFGFASGQVKNVDKTGTNKDAVSPSKYAFENPCLRLNSPEKLSDIESKPSKKRKSDAIDNNEPGLSSPSKRLKQDHEGNYKLGFVNAALDLEDRSNEVPNGKEFEVSRAQFGLTNCALDLTDEIEDKKRVTFNDHVEYSTDCIKKKKEKVRLDRFEVENKKFKRKRKIENISSMAQVISGFVNEALDFEEVSVEINDNEVNERKSRKAKKRRDSRRSNLETIVETPEEDKEVPENGSFLNSVDTQVMENNFETSLSDESISNKLKKKKKKKDKENVREETAEEKVGGNKNELENNEIESINGEKKLKGDAGFKEYVPNPEKSPLEGKKKKKKSKNHADSITKKREPSKIQVQIVQETKQIEDQDNGTSKIKKDKKKKKKEKNFEHSFGTDLEISMNESKDGADKENSSIERDVTVKEKKPKKDKKRRKSIERLEYDNSTCNVECIPEESAEAINSTNTPTKNSENNEVFSAVRSPWNEKAKMSKKLLKSLFYRNSVTNFPGSNIHDIKGYGEGLE